MENKYKYSISNTQKILICPGCNVQLPTLRYQVTNSKLIIQPCCYLKGSYSSSGVDHFKQQLASIKVESNDCTEHNKKQLKWCYSCKQWQCEDCLVAHAEKFPLHSFLLDFKFVNCKCERRYSSEKECNGCNPDQNEDGSQSILLNDLFEKTCALMETVIEENSKVKDEFIQRLEQKHKDTNNNKVSHKISTINELVKANSEVNLQFKELIEYIKATLSFLGPFYHKRLSDLINSTRPCKRLLIDKEASEDQCYEIIKDHYRHNFMMYQVQSTEAPIKIASITSLTALRGHNMDVSCLAELKCGLIASGAFDNFIQLWDLNTYSRVGTLIGTSFVRCLLELSNGLLASGYNNCTISIWDVTERKEVKSLSFESEAVICMLETNSMLVASFENATVRFFGLADYSLKQIAFPKSKAKCMLELSGNQLVFGLFKDYLQIFSTKTSQAVTMTKGRVIGVTALCHFSNTQFAAALSNNFIEVYNALTLLCITVVEAHNQLVRSMIQLADKRVVTASDDGTLKLWDKAFNCRGILEGHRFRVWYVIQTKSGIVISASEDQSILLWNLPE